MDIVHCLFSKKNSAMEQDDTTTWLQVDVPRFNIVFPRSEDQRKPTEFPLTQWFTMLEIQGKWWQKVLFIMIVSFPILIVLSGIDLVIWLVKFIITKCGELYSVALQSFGAKFLKCLGIGLFAFFVFWAVKSGYWEKLFSWCSQLL